MLEEEVSAAVEGEAATGEGDGESAGKERKASESASPEVTRKKNSTPKVSSVPLKHLFRI